MVSLSNHGRHRFWLHPYAAKFSGYFALPPVFHYLIVDIEKRLILHHQRGDGDLLTTRIVRAGALTLDPPGVALDFASCFQTG